MSSDAVESRLDRIQRVRSAFSEKALDEVYQELFNSKRPSHFDEASLESLDKKAFRKKGKKLYQVSLRHQIRNYLVENQISPDLGLPDVKKLLIDYIHSQPFIERADKAWILHRIEVTRLVAMTHLYLDDEVQDTSADIKELYIGCAKNHFQDNAYAATTRSGEKIIAICPGSIIGVVEFSKQHQFSQNYQMLSLAMTLVHELSHHFDFEKIPQIYPQLLPWMKKNEHHFEFSSEKYGAEISADIWAIRIFDHLIARLPARDQNLLIKASLEDLCPSQDDGVHPSGLFRIETLAGQLFCQRPSPEPPK